MRGTCCAPVANYLQKEAAMRASKLMRDLRRQSFGVSSEPDCFDGYEQRLTRWGCEKCKFFEKRVFSTGSASDELDAYIICRFAGEPIDLIAEATACPKDCGRKSLENRIQSGLGRLHCVHSLMPPTLT